ncbi:MULTISPECIES: glycosyltransferase [unclassified Pannonibacter]|uniref:glycosyltransferase n=1 Tax=unclassified Pannonibacter TaxID=2627228 RepID=UPI00164686B4|nr:MULTISPECIES: glycosyltransferase [unclassified Pannonibacter]
MTNTVSTSPLVSVIIPVYNHGRYIVDALMSVVQQDWRPLEIIVIDDGSKDDSVQKLEAAVANLQIAPDLTIQISSRENRGAHNTINEGLERARGEYLAILNSDDYYLPGRIRRCVEAALAHKARFVFTYVDPIDDDGAPLPAEHRWRHWYADLKMQELDIAPSISQLLLRYNIGVSTGNFFFHKSLIQEIGLFNDFRYAHDLDFMLRVSALEEPVLIRDKLYAYRIHASNTIGESDNLITDEVARIVRSYLKRSAEVHPANPLAPRLDHGCYTLATTVWPPHLEKAVDGLMHDPSLARTHRSTSEPEDLATAPQKGTERSQITLISHELSRTGAPVLLRDVASALHQLNVSTHVISLGTGPLADDYARMKSPVVTEDTLSHLLSKAGGFLMQLADDRRVPVLAKRPLTFSAKLSGALGARIRILRYRMKTSGKGPLLVNSFASWPLALPLLEKWNGPAFWYIHETYEPSLVMRSGRHLTRLRRLADQKRVVFLFGSDATRQKWADEGYDGEVFYWSGLKHSSGSRLVLDQVQASTKRVILSVQSTGPRKGTWNLIEAFAEGIKKGLIADDVQLHIIGAHAPSRNALSRDLLVRVLKNDLRDRVQLIPNLAPEELSAHYASASVYVQSSTMECLPLALLNAMAFGLPIVSTDADGCREAILHERTGLLIPPRQPEMMAMALGALLNDTGKSEALAKNARKLFEEKFAVEVTAPKLMERIISTA